MKKKDQIKLDKKDRLIMRELEQNSRQSYTKLGKKVGSSAETVEYRIKKLVNSGIIIRMFAEPNLHKLGLTTYRLFMKVENLTQKDEKAFVDYLMNHPRAQWFAEFEGVWDYTIRYSLRNEIELREELEKLMQRFGSFIKAKNIAITIEQHYLPSDHLTGGHGRIHHTSLKKEAKTLDIIDQKIMFYLFENARMKTTELASKIGISPDAVQYRIKKLIKNGIISFFGVYYNPPSFGYTRYKIFFWLQYTEKEKEEKLIRYCMQHPHSSYLNKNAGDWDLEADFDAKNPQQLRDIIKTLRNKFSDIIRDHSVLIILREHVPNPFKGF